jgi:SAM-dependent methyltransferase
LLIEQQIDQFDALNTWFQSALGKAVSDEFVKQVSPLSNYLKGDTLLQLGCCDENSWLDAFDFKSKWIAAPNNIKNKVDLTCSLIQIPLNRNSVDCVIAPLTIEPFSNDLSLIDEIDRILTPMGYAVFFCINPWSMWGGAMKGGMLHCFADKKVKLHTPIHLNRLLIQRGYRQCLLSNFCYVPPVSNPIILKKLAFFNEIGKILWPFPSGFYCYIAQKYVPIAPLVIEPIPVTKEYESPFQASI